MRVVVSLLHHFRRTPDGIVYPYSVFDYTFWKRYLDVFDEVLVFARVEDIPEVDPSTMPAKSSGPGVTFHSLPEWRGAKDYAKKYFKIDAMVKDTVKGDDAFVLRAPNYLSSMLWRKLKKNNRPYAVEVVGDPWQAMCPGSYPGLMRPVYRRIFYHNMKRQCRDAIVSAYVTEKALQKRYPPGHWSTHYSSIELPEDVVIDESLIEKRILRVDQKVQSNEPWRLCFVGSLWHLAKSPDVLIDAVADCVQKGFDIELTMVGDGHLMGSLEQQAKSCGISEKVKFLGHLPPGKQIYGQLDKADVFILPSRSEGLPRSVIEAFARGVPSIGGCEGGFPELLLDECMVKKIDLENMSKIIRDTISNPEGMKKSIIRNVEKAQEYCTGVLQKRRIELYSRLKRHTSEWLKNN